jgi:hypothetical protein
MGQSSVPFSWTKGSHQQSELKRRLGFMIVIRADRIFLLAIRLKYTFENVIPSILTLFNDLLFYHVEERAALRSRLSNNASKPR